MPFTWKYTSGSLLPTGATMPTTADDVRPNGYAFRAGWGSDLSGNGSRKFPFRTLAKAGATAGNGGTVITDSTTSYEGDIPSRFVIISDGQTTLDATGWNSIINASGNSSFYNLTLKNGNRVTNGNSSTYERCRIENFAFLDFVNPGNNYARMRYCLLQNVYGFFTVSYWGAVVGGHFGNTYNSCQLLLTLGNGAPGPFQEQNAIFNKCELRFASAISMAYCLFSPDTKFVFGASGGTFKTYATIDALRADYAAFFGSAVVQNFEGCKIADPKFNDPANGDFTLAFDSPARNMGFDGKAIGAYGLAQKTDNSNVIYSENITFSGGKAFLTDANQSGLIRYAIRDLGAEYPLNAPFIAGVMADRNGEYFDTSKDVSETTTAAGAGLKADTAYVVENGTINHAGTMYNIGQRFTNLAAGTVFSTTEGGVVREILDTPNRYTLRMKTSRSIGTAEYFDTLPWHEYEIGQKVTANRQDDLGTGTILRGNGARDFVRTPASKVLPVFARFYQVEIVIQTNALRS